MEKEKFGEFYFYIDVVGACNLACPSCPMGNSTDVLIPRGLMEKDLLDKILTKAVSECTVTGVGLYNWTEPLLHPRLPELIETVQAYGIPCGISTNLNILKNPDALMKANPHSIYISLSGFNQETYQVTHRQGDIEKVKINIDILLKSKKKNNSSTNITIIFHKYLSNYDELILFKTFAQERGINFMEQWAVMLPLEKVLLYKSTRSCKRGNITNEDQTLINNLALPIDEALKISKNEGQKKCGLLTSQISMNFMGDVQQCCAVFDQNKFTVKNYLDVPISEIQSIRKENRVCEECIDIGANAYYGQSLSQLNDAAFANIISYKNKFI